MFEISQNELSEGSKIVKNARIVGQLETAAQGYNEEDDMEAKLKRYFAILEIPEAHFEFVTTLIKFTCVKRKKSKHSGMKARCAGAIFMLSESEPALKITKIDIATKCNISAATFMRFANIITELINLPEDSITHRKLAHIYKKHIITIPA
jgi:hypothetical protein